MKAGNGTNPNATAKLSIRAEEAPVAAPVPQTGDNTPLEWLGETCVWMGQKNSAGFRMEGAERVFYFYGRIPA